MTSLKENRCERCGDLFEQGYENGQEDYCQICAEHIQADEEYREHKLK